MLFVVWGEGGFFFVGGGGGGLHFVYGYLKFVPK